MNNKKNNIILFVWLFIIGCLVGYAVETLWYFIKHGIFINKQGLIYGPFKPIYGLGILVITFVFRNLKNKNIGIIFLLGTFFGSLYEYLLSLFQEFVLHTSTWNYSSFNYNINGRIYLPYCLGWGLFTLIWVKLIYPRIKKAVLKIPYTLTIIVGILMILDVIISAFAVYEFSNRQNNIEPSNKILKVMDKFYPDDVMEKKYPKLRAIKK